MRLRGRHYATGNLVDVEVSSGRIESIETAIEGAVPDAEAGWLAPAFFDLQINGCLGISFNSPELCPEQVETVVNHCQQHGIAGLLPTLVTASSSALEHGFRTICRAIDLSATVAESVPGLHLEGPYISPEDGARGAHPLEHVRDPDIDEFRRLQESASGRIRLVTLAPERPGAIPLIEYLVRSGIVVAIGHTAGTPAQIRDGIAAGARLSTHLGNGSHAMLPRHENYIWEQLAADELLASVISDGHHLPASLVKCIVRVKSAKNVVITCDASSLAGLPPGKYAQWGTTLEVQPHGKVVVPGTPFLAGSGVFTDSCVSTMLQMTSVHLAEAIDMASSNPRRLLGLPVWELRPGRQCPVMLFDRDRSGEMAVRGIFGRQPR